VINLGKSKCPDLSPDRSVIEALRLALQKQSKKAHGYQNYQEFLNKAFAHGGVLCHEELLV